MDEKEYFRLLNKCANEQNSLIAINNLKKLYEIKPVRLKWFVEMAKAMMKEDYDIGEIYAILLDKAWTLYNYKDVLDYEKTYLHLAEKINDVVEQYRVQYIIDCLCNYCGVFNSDISKINIEVDSYINQLLQEFLQDNCELEKLRRLKKCLYIKQEFVLHIIVDFLINKGSDSYIRKWVLQITNIGFLREKLSNKGGTFIVIANKEHDRSVYEAAVHALHLLGKQVIWVDIPIEIETDGPVSMCDLLRVSIDNIELKDQVTVIHPIQNIVNQTNIYSNIDYILDYIHKEYCKNEIATVLCNGRTIDQLCSSTLLQKNIRRLYNFREDYSEDNLTFGYIGDYCTHISELYCLDVKNKIYNIKSDCNFSIVIPVRNVSETLKYTLKTCLEQTYDGKYEIIVSDNSTYGNSFVYDLCKEFHDERIVYIKTPRDLRLSKSFEYAYLHARGEYVFAIGADDGVLPWALQSLEEVIEKYPDEEIIQWERGFYAWPGFNGGQQNQFVIPRKYSKNYNIYYKKNIDYLAMVLNDPSNMYTLPMLYINSCFKRSYLKTLLRKTGCLWDGICQDIYIGVINVCINQRILNLEYPLTIAGMSNTSIGANANRGKHTSEEYNQSIENIERENNIGGYCTNYIERIIPYTGTDTNSLYYSLLRAISIGVLPEFYLREVFDWKKIFKTLASELDIRDVAYDKKIHEMRYAARNHGEEFLRWFDDNIYNPGLKPIYIDEKKIHEIELKKTYTNDINTQGGITVDASEFGVKNIYDAVKLFKKFTEL